MKPVYEKNALRDRACCLALLLADVASKARREMRTSGTVGMRNSCPSGPRKGRGNPVERPWTNSLTTASSSSAAGLGSPMTATPPWASSFPIPCTAISGVVLCLNSDPHSTTSNWPIFGLPSDNHSSDTISCGSAQTKRIPSQWMPIACICRCAYAKLLSLASTAVIKDSGCNNIEARATGSPEPQPSTRTFLAPVLEVDSPSAASLNSFAALWYPICLPARGRDGAQRHHGEPCSATWEYSVAKRLSHPLWLSR
mmetsp:Transcript_50260/g.89729  ORF Transcript_50260/g.89729 Transcript_50260/m.89729 type:complete len:255 (+) Transcript_50260:881-1645(+)